MTTTPKLILAPKREASVARRHPWIFSGAIAQAENPPESGGTVHVHDHDGHFLVSAAWSPTSQIRARLWSFDPDEAIDAAFFHRRLERALSIRKDVPPLTPTNALRLVYAEADDLPGLIVDRYGDFLVCQFLAAGPERFKAEIVDGLRALLPDVRGIYERSDVDVRHKEGLEPTAGLLWGEEPPETIEIYEGSLRLLVDVRHGHKTGFYLDQRDHRARIAGFAQGAEVLNAFAYTGGFGLSALQAGAERVVQVETSDDANALSRRMVELNGLDAARIEHESEDVFKLLRRYRDSRQTFDVIVLDPPKFAATASQVERASRGYKDINLLAMKLLRPGGTLFTFSCSGHITPPLFRKIVADASVDAARQVQVLESLDQALDHRVLLHFPEGHYLKGLICKVF